MKVCVFGVVMADSAMQGGGMGGDKHDEACMYQCKTEVCVWGAGDSLIEGCVCVICVW